MRSEEIAVYISGIVLKDSHGNGSKLTLILLAILGVEKATR
jgi:hypothetical protein